ncbi:MAG: hypothetical protein J0L89_00430 [Xanthomonadales bacterium]|nr:hypothetical protein [Xanthomonadaceae bacterium]MBN8223264.1 hypothetical protein [Xanthomonadales bacterium]MCA0197343.1 hypothetical protein [Pseudomonadota bacterium]HRF82881.1 hypothetical protein [Pseudoxanthomonas sp.]
MIDKPDALWDPALEADAELQRLAALLAAFRHVPDPRFPARVWQRPPRGRRPRWLLASAAAVAACAVGLALWLPWRLQWNEGAHWAVVAGAGAAPGALEVGTTWATSERQTATIRIARIGSMQVLPDTRIRLRDTRSGHHRLELVEGRVRARIWAPPGYFGVAAGAGETLDLGCEFEMSRDVRGAGSIQVASGWVMHRVGGQETLVPAGSTLAFDDVRSGIPLAIHAGADFREAVRRLDLAMLEGRRAPGLESAVAAGAAAEDRFSLLALLTRYPELASGPLYPRLAALLGEPGDDPQHRQAWQAGNAQAMEAWWARIPRPPKAWWLNWRDAFG